MTLRADLVGDTFRASDRGLADVGLWEQMGNERICTEAAAAPQAITRLGKTLRGCALVLSGSWYPFWGMRDWTPIRRTGGHAFRANAPNW